MSVKKYIFYVVLLTGIFTLVGYYYLGGFTERSLALVEVDAYHLAGKRYQGSLDSPELEAIFYEVRQKMEQETLQEGRQGALSGTLAIVVLKEPAHERDTVDQFIGILLDHPAAMSNQPGGPVADGETYGGGSPGGTGPERIELPEGWETFSLEASQAVRNTIIAHHLVLPKPNIIREEIQEFARQKNLSLKEDVLIEKYIGERHMEVEIPVAD